MPMSTSLVSLYNGNTVTAEDVSRHAAHWDMDVNPATDVVTDPDGFHSIDGMPAGDWLDAMTMD